LKVKIVLRNPVNKKDQIDYTIDVHDHTLSRDWIVALKKLLQNGNLLEKNYCFMGFPKTHRTVEYLCEQLNQAVRQINKFGMTNTWQSNGLKEFYIEDYYCEETVRWPADYGLGHPLVTNKLMEYYPGLMPKHNTLNRLHYYFEQLQGTVNHLSPYYKLADHETKYAIRQLNNCCHELENIILSQRKEIVSPYWVRPSQITTWINANRYQLDDEHRQGFNTNSYDRVLGGVYMHWAQIGKTLFEVWRDEDAPELTEAVCSAITHLEHYSGEFDIEWGNDVVYSDKCPWHVDEQNQFKAWLIKNNLDPENSKLSLGYLPIGQVDLLGSFGTTNYQKIWKVLGNYLDIYRVEVDGVSAQYDYCWSDDNYKQQQIDRMRAGYDYHTRK
jgi:hypothetical protein